LRADQAVGGGVEYRSWRQLSTIRLTKTIFLRDFAKSLGWPLSARSCQIRMLELENLAPFLCLVLPPLINPA
jgi:hypothetical protein